MTSINFNASATTALRTLQQTNSALEASQNRVSTGLKIGEAKDNAAYWSISTTLKSDNAALSTVKDALGLGAATVDVAYQGLNQSLDVLNEIKSKLTAATQEGLDKSKIQAEITQLKSQLESIATSSSFSGQNWLSDATAANTTANIVSSFTRNGAGDVSVGTIAVTTSSLALYRGAAGSETGILDRALVGTTTDFETSQAYDLDAPIVFAADTMNFEITQGFKVTDVNINKAVVDTALGVTNGTITTQVELAAVMNEALRMVGVTGIVASAEGGTLTFTSNEVFTTGVAAKVSTNTDTSVTVAALGLETVAQPAVSGGSISMSVADINVANFDSQNRAAVKAEIDAMIDIVSQAADLITANAANLGAIAKRIELQDSFVSSLIDTIDKGVSDLIDADLSEESTRLQALQTKQQLGIQALSIANSSTQSVLSLFRS